MKKKIILAFFVIGIIAQNSFASEGIWAKEIDLILDKNGLTKNQYGIEIRSSDGNKIYYSANSTKAFNPASTLKILVSIVALEQLGPQYKFQTLIKKQGNDLCLVGMGDPSLVYEDIFLMTEELLRSPILGKTVENIFVDDSIYPTTRQYEAEFDGDSQRSFTAPLSALSLNYNSVSIFAKPGKPGQPAEIYTEPRSSYFVIHNTSKTTQMGEKNINVRTESGGNKINILISGQIPTTAKEQIIYRAVVEPTVYAGSIFKDMLERADIIVAGSVQKKTCSKDSTELVTYKSKPLSQIIQGMNKFSNNFIAESLLYQLGDQPTSQSGLEKMLSWSKNKNLPLNNVNILNASGLSRENSVTPLFLWQLFSYGKNTFQISPELMNSLPIGGIDGTLRRRFKNEKTLGKVRAKSGSLKNTVSLVGTIHTEKNGELLFTFLFKDTLKTTQQIQSIEEKIIETMVKLGGL